MDINEILLSAEKLFINKEYDNALKFYSHALSKERKNIDALVGVILSDFGINFREDAQVLYYYYQTQKEFFSNPVEAIEQLANNLIQNRASDVYDLIDEDIALNDGIEYEDFVNLIESKENFQEAFEDAIFSTRVVISKKWQFIDFIERLTDNGYFSVALDYLETHSPMYGADQEILSLYSLLPKGEMWSTK